MSYIRSSDNEKARKSVFTYHQLSIQLPCWSHVIIHFLSPHILILNSSMLHPKECSWNMLLIRPWIRTYEIWTIYSELIFQYFHASYKPYTSERTIIFFISLSSHTIRGHSILFPFVPQVCSKINLKNMFFSEHVSQESLIAVAVGCVLTILLLILIIIYVVKANKCCGGCCCSDSEGYKDRNIHQKELFKPSDHDR